MIHEDASGRRDTSRSRTWIAGGILLLAAGILPLGSQLMGPMIPIGKVGEVCLAAALIVFAVGLGRGGSVTARRPLGTIALIALAVWTLLAPVLLWLFLEPMTGSGTLPDLGVIALVGMLSTSALVVSLVLAVIGVSQIGRLAVVPPPWNWAPLWALAVVVAARLPMMLPFLALADQGALTAISGIVVLLESAAVCFLGVVAIMLAGRPARDRTVPVYPPAPL